MYYRILCAIFFFIVFSSIFIYFAFIHSISSWYEGNLVFQENFQGSYLNSSRWDLANDFNYIPGMEGKEKPEYFTDEWHESQHIQVKDGFLKVSPKFSPLPSMGNILRSVQIHQRKFDGFDNGAFIIRAKLPINKFIASSIRLVYFDHCLQTQIIVVQKPAEILLVDNKEKSNTIIFGADVAIQNTNNTKTTKESKRNYKKQQQKRKNNNSFRITKKVGYSTRNFDLNTAYHEYGVLWTKEKISWYFDNTRYYEMDLDLKKYWNSHQTRHDSSNSSCFPSGQHLFLNHMKFLIDLDIYPGYTNHSNNDLKSSVLDIDWIRVYKQGSV